MTSYAHDVAISAVASDGGLVAELVRELATRVTTPPVWQGDHSGDLMSAGHSRVALVLHQHLWQHDAQSLRDAAELRTRIAARPGSICVLALDDSPVASWLAEAPRYCIAESGRAGAADFVAGVVAAAGGTVRPAPQAAAADESVMRWPEPPTPFLAQPRAQAALRHELDDIIAGLEREIARERAARPDGSYDLHVRPNRVVARLDDVAMSFSWLTTGLANVAEGRLMVIAWRGVDRAARGVPTFTPAAALHESVYAAAGNSADEWRWRGDDRAQRPYTSEQLVADWLARACIARGA